MRKEPLLTAVPPAPVASLSELYAIALDQAQKGAQRYGALAVAGRERPRGVRSRQAGIADIGNFARNHEIDRCPAQL